jgi:hypothetical protein
MQHNDSIRGFTPENTAQMLTGVILIAIALISSDALPSGVDLFSIRSLPLWLFIVIMVIQGMRLIFKANEDQKQRYKTLKETNNENN